MRNAARFGTLLLLGVLLAGCGVKDDTSENDAAPTVSSSNADVDSGCWTASQRVPVIEGADQMLQWKEAPAMTIDPAKTYTAEIVTNKGAFEVAFFPGDAPNTVNNFVCLAKAGYFDNTPFHRIISGFVIQGGDPTGTGTGGPGYRFADEPISRDYTKGTLAMANAGANTNGSQFFVVLEDLTGGRLPKNYTIFGEVTSGIDVVDAIGQTPVRASGSGERSSPTEPITLESVTITES